MYLVTALPRDLLWDWCSHALPDHVSLPPPRYHQSRRVVANSSPRPYRTPGFSEARKLLAPTDPAGHPTVEGHRHLQRSTARHEFARPRAEH